MKIYEELQARGLIAQVTNEPEIREMVNNGKATFYIGFDPTADSLHVGHICVSSDDRFGRYDKSQITAVIWLFLIILSR